MKAFNCDSCGQKMEVQKSFGVKPRGEKNKRYRIRRFYCSLCDIYKTIFADGYYDENSHNLVTNKNK